MKKLFVNTLAKECFQECTEMAKQLYVLSFQALERGDKKNADYYGDRWAAVMDDRDFLVANYPCCNKPYTTVETAVLGFVKLCRWFNG